MRRRTRRRVVCFHSHPMKALGFFAGLAVALAVWLATFAAMAVLLEKTPVDYRQYGLVAVIAVIVGGALGGWRAGKETVAAVDRAGRRAARRRAAKLAAGMRVVRQESQQVADRRLFEKDLQTRLDGARELAQQLPALLRDAEAALDDADREFILRGLVPFWEAIERAAESLANFNDALEALAEKCRSYRRDSARLDAAAPPFTLGVAALPDPTHAARRMEETVERTRSDLDFSAIYELRKSGVIPAAGFHTLAHAIHGLPGTLSLSLKSLTSTIASPPANSLSAKPRKAACS